MGIEYKLSDIEPAKKNKDFRIELAPRNQCRKYVSENGGEATLITKKEFDKHCKSAEFSDRPYRDNFGDGNGEPYNPNRQAFGKLDSGLVVYCELSDEHQKKTKDLFESINGLDSND